MFDQTPPLPSSDGPAVSFQTGQPVSAPGSIAPPAQTIEPRSTPAMQVAGPQGHYGAAQQYMVQEVDEYGNVIGEWMQNEDFTRNFQFGIIDNGLLVAMTLAGVSLEDRIADAVGVSGYGAIMGATIGNAVSDGVAALPQGYKAAAGVTLGCLLPVLPLAGAMVMKKEIKGTTRNVLLGTSAALLAFAFLSKKLKPAGPAPA